MANLIKTALRLTDAVNRQYGAHILISSSKFFGDNGRPVTVFVVEDSYKPSNGGRIVRDELFRSSSGAYVCFFLRDLLYTLEGKEIPPDEVGGIHTGWVNIKKKKDIYKSIEFIKEKYVDKLPDCGD
jgi:hypothetical protein